MPSTAVAELRQQLAAVIAGTPSTTPGLPTGMTPLDDILPGGGIPTGRITEILAAPGLGKTTLARSLVTTTLRRGSAVAWVDATRTLDPRDWVAGAHARMPGVFAQVESDALWMVRPPDAARGPWCADLLLRSGAFALVVLDGAPVLPRVVAVRLAQLARESDAALLLLGDGTRASEIGGALRLRLSAASPGHPPGAALLRGHPAATITATLEKGGPYSHVQLELGHDIGERDNNVARRLCAHPQVPDRRGVARTRKPEAGRAAAGNGAGNSAGSAARSRVGVRGRRFAQPDYPQR
jgi:hypothetical protein